MNAHILLNFIQTHQNSIWHSCGVWGCQLIYIVFPYRCVDIQSVVWRRRSYAEVGLFYF